MDAAAACTDCEKTVGDDFDSPKSSKSFTNLKTVAWGPQAEARIMPTRFRSASAPCQASMAASNVILLKRSARRTGDNSGFLNTSTGICNTGNNSLFPIGNGWGAVGFFRYTLSASTPAPPAQTTPTPESFMRPPLHGARSLPHYCRQRQARLKSHTPGSKA